VIHRVTCTAKGQGHEGRPGETYSLDVPYLRAGSNKSNRVKGQKQLRDANSDFEQKNDISFAAYIVYSCNNYNQDIAGTFDRLLIPQID
jgi:hypothetical protein